MADQNHEVGISFKEQGLDAVQRRVNELEAKINKIDGKQVNVPIKETGGQQAAKSLGDVEEAAKKAASGADGLSGQISQLAGRFSSMPGPIGEMASGLESAIGSMDSFVTGLGGGVLAIGGLAVGAVALAGVLEGMATEMNLAADDAVEMADKFGLTTEKLHAMQVLAEDNSGSFEGYEKAVEKLAKSMSKLDDENAKTEKSLAQLGISFNDFKAMSPEDQLYAIVQAYEASGRSAETLGAANQIAGGGFRDLIPMIKATHDELGNTVAMSEKYGNVITAEMKEKGAAAEKATRELTESVGGLKIALTGDFGDVTIAFRQGLAKANNELRENMHLLDEWMRKNVANPIRGAFGFDPLKSKNYTAAQYANSGNEDAGNEAARAEGFAKKAQEANAKREMAANAARDAAREAAKKAAADAEAAAKAAAANAERIKKLGEDTVIGGERALLVAREASKEELARFDTTKGKLKEISAAAKETYINGQKELDVQEKLNTEKEKQRKIDEKITKDIESRIKKMNELADKAVNEAEDFNKKSGLDASFVERTRGMGGIDRDLVKKQDERATKFDSERRELNKVYAGAEGKGTEKEQKDAAEAHVAALARIDEAERLTSQTIIEQAAVRKAAEADWMGGFQDGVADYLDKANDMSSQMNNVGKNLFQGMEDALVNFVMTGKLNFADFAKSIIADLARIAAKKAIVGLFNMAFGGSPVASSGSYASNDWLASAKGNVFSGGDLVPFAKGGVFGEPTTFPMKGGKTGLMAEAGPEAIMPLKRGADGKLGVMMSGGASSGGSGDVHLSFGDIIIQGGETNNETAAAMRKEIIAISKSEAIKAIAKQKNQNGGLLYNR